MEAEKSAIDSTKKFIILFTLCFVLIYLDYSNQRIFKKTKTVINDVSSYVSYWIIIPFQLISDIPDAIYKISSLKKESEKIELLKNKVQDLKKNNDYLNKEINKLRNFLSDESSYTNASLIAKVLFNNKNIFSKSIILNKGFLDGVKIGNPVVKNNNLIGQVAEVNLKSSRVILVEDLNSRIPVMIGKKLHQGIMIGSADKRNVIFEFLPKNYEIQNQDKIYTSEIEGILPKGIYIGKIKIDNFGTYGFSVEFEYNKFNLDYLSIIIPNK